MSPPATWGFPAGGNIGRIFFLGQAFNPNTFKRSAGRAPKRMQDMNENDMTDLIDFRCKVTERTNQVLEAHARADNADKAEVARAILDQWAASEIHKATLIHRLTRSEGTTAANGGV